MKPEEVKITETTAFADQLDAFLEDGWIIIGIHEFLEESHEQMLKKTKWTLGHSNESQITPKFVSESRRAIVEAHRRR